MAIRHYWENKAMNSTQTLNTIFNPLIIGNDLTAIIANPNKWVKTFGTGYDENSSNFVWLEENNISVEGCTITFPSEKVKILFLLKFQ